MEITEAYATVVGGVFSIYFVIAILPYLMPFIEKICLFASKHLIYPQFIHCHQLLGHWTLMSIFIQLRFQT